MEETTRKTKQYTWEDNIRIDLTKNMLGVDWFI